MLQTSDLERRGIWNQCSENKGTDQLRGYAKIRISHDADHIKEELKKKRIYTVSAKKKAHFSRRNANKANGKLAISRRNSEKKEKFRGEISRRFAAKMVIMTWVLKMYSPRFAAKQKRNDLVLNDILKMIF